MKLSAPIFRLKRQAKLLAREDGIPLHEAQDRIARSEGFQRWSQLAAQHAETSVAKELLDGLQAGELVLLAGKREHGKTTLAFHLIAEAAAVGRSSAYFSLDESDEDVVARLEVCGVDGAAVEAYVSYDTSDAIEAAYIAERCAEAPAGTLVVVDYLQILDQQRHKPDLDQQVAALRAFAVETGSIVVVLAQIDRSFDATGASTPALEHIRMPNPIDLGRFDKACFIHEGEITVAAAA